MKHRFLSDLYWLFGKYRKSARHLVAAQMSLAILARDASRDGGQVSRTQPRSRNGNKALPKSRIFWISPQWSVVSEGWNWRMIDAVGRGAHCGLCLATTSRSPSIEACPSMIFFGVGGAEPFLASVVAWV